MEQKEHRLKANALGLSEAVVMGVAGTAPAFSLAATTSILIAAAGLTSIASLFYSGVIMMGIILSFLRLNNMEVNAGGCYIWIGRIFHPVLGFFAGWSLLVASALFMVSGTIPAATATLELIHPSSVNNPIAVNAVAACWLSCMGLVVLKGIKVSSYVQIILTFIEVFLLMFIIFAGYKMFSPQPIASFTLANLSLSQFTPTTFATGALTSLFFFWGWDVTINLSEETKSAHTNSGLGALLSLFVTFAIFMSFILVVQMAMSPQDIEKTGTNIVFELSNKIFSSPLSYIAIIAVMLSTLGTVETTMLQFSRTMFSKGRNGDLNSSYAMVHKTWKTPYKSVLVIIEIGLLLLFASSFIPTVGQIISISVNSIGLLVAFYYGLTGFACAWHFRLEKKKSLLNTILYFVWPLLSALFMGFIFFYSIYSLDATTSLMGLGGIIMGIIPFLWNKMSPSTPTG